MKDSLQQYIDELKRMQEMVEKLKGEFSKLEGMENQIMEDLKSGEGIETLNQLRDAIDSLEADKQKLVEELEVEFPKLREEFNKAKENL